MVATGSSSPTVVTKSASPERSRSSSVPRRPSVTRSTVRPSRSMVDRSNAPAARRTRVCSGALSAGRVLLISRDEGAFQRVPGPCFSRQRLSGSSQSRLRSTLSQTSKPVTREPPQGAGLTVPLDRSSA